MGKTQRLPTIYIERLVDGGDWSGHPQQIKHVFAVWEELAAEHKRELKWREVVAHLLYISTTHFQVPLGEA